jgi:hypothetical protein
LDHEVIGTVQIIQYNPFLPGGRIVLHMHHTTGRTPEDRLVWVDRDGILVLFYVFCREVRCGSRRWKTW